MSHRPQRPEHPEHPKHPEHTDHAAHTDHREKIAARYGETTATAHTASPGGAPLPTAATIDRLLDHRSCRRYTDAPVPEAVLETLIACTQSAPTKSNLQQYSIIHINDSAQRRRLAPHCPKTPQLPTCPILLIFCADLARNKAIAESRGYGFENAHLDGLINGVIDAAMAMQCFITAAESIGLGCAAISEIRDEIDAVAEILELPEGVFPIAGLTAGWPADAGYINQRLPADIVMHRDKYDATDLAAKVSAYDRRRHEIFPTPPSRQILTDRYGTCDYYPWSENMARQMSVRERAMVARFLRVQGFELE